MMIENEIITRAVNSAGIEVLNDMQRKVLEAGTTKDLVLLSPTGSGKTLAFLLPMLSELSENDHNIRALIVAPSRELALQIETVFRSLGSGCKVNCCYGGHPLRVEKKSLEHPPALLIATPGRLVDHLDRGNIDLTTVRTLVLDEFDKSLELGFTKEMKEILAHLPGLRHRVLTSATSAVDIPAFIGIRSPIRLSFLQDPVKKNIPVYTVASPVKDKLETLYKLLGELGGESVLVFCNLREAVERVSGYLTEMEVENEAFHGGMEQLDRERVLSRFRNGSVSVFVSTDLASRGLDISDVRHIIHYHLPVNEEAYIHRNGRTARMDADGDAFLILNEIDVVPEYVENPTEFYLPEKSKRPPSPVWATLTINRGKRDKLSKKDIVGFLYQKGHLDKDDLGMVEVRDGRSFVAVKRDKLNMLVSLIRNEKIKNMTFKLG